jgi:hypothetical protein
MDEINEEEILKFIPLDKSWLIRMGILDLTRGFGSRDLLNFLNSCENLGNDLEALKRIALVWDTNEPFDVGESGTIYRFIKFYLLKNNIDREIKISETLIHRVKKMNINYDMINWPLAKLGTLEGGTTQWQTMAILLGNKEKLSEIPFYLQKTYDAIQHWEEKRKNGQMWIAQKDPTLLVQSTLYLNFLKNGKIDLIPTKLGDCDLYCFLRAFDAVGKKWAEKNWPQLSEHESSRFEEMERTLLELEKGETISTKDHRVVQAEAMLLLSKSHSISVESIKQRFDNPQCVNKTWKSFWSLAMPYFHRVINS